MRSASVTLALGIFVAACGTSTPAGNDAAVLGDTHVSAFTALAPCTTELAYVAGTAGANVVTFGPAFAYTPSCLRISAGSQVTFRGDFAVHPLMPSTRGTTGNPIPATGPTAPPAEQTVTFATAGFYPYYCAVHGSDTGTAMSGVVWVE